MFKPHRPQKRELIGSEVLHRGQGYVDGASPGLTSLNDPLPHRPQNLTPSAKREPQLEHATMPGITLEGIAPPLPCDDEG